MKSVTLDTGALIALERGSRRMIALLEVAREAPVSIAVPVCVIAEAWRGGPRQARIARLLRAPITEVVPLDEIAARAVGVLCGRTSTADITDASVVLCARERRHGIVTGDPEDLRRIDGDIALFAPD